jgi:hypothetical protein
MKTLHSFTKKHLAGKVTSAPYTSLPGASRKATVFAERYVLRELFGAPTNPAFFDGKVTEVWTFQTPRGLVHLRDYWWNRDGEWSVGAHTGKAAQWLRRHVYACLERRRSPD